MSLIILGQSTSAAVFNTDERLTEQEAAAKFGVTVEQVKKIKDTVGVVGFPGKPVCLSELLLISGNSEMTALGDTIFAKSGENTIIYSPNNRSTMVSKEGNCGPTANDDKKNFKTLVANAVDAARKRVQSGKISERKFNEVLKACQASPTPAIQNATKGLSDTGYDKLPGNSGSPSIPGLNQPAGTAQ